MTKCESWCGMMYMNYGVPLGGAFLPGCDGEGGPSRSCSCKSHMDKPAYCSQACLDRATAKPATTAPERKLAKGWVRCKHGYMCCGTDDNGHYHKGGVAAAYLKGIIGACEAHAAEMGVFEQTHVGAVDFGGNEVVVTCCPDCAVEYKGPHICLPASALHLLKWVGPNPTFERRGEQVVAVASKCPTCTHRHVGPCSGRSPNGEYSCPCGHERVEAKREVLLVGVYSPGNDESARARTDKRDGRDPFDGTITRGSHTATLLANLERERVPGRRPIRTVRWYEGNGDE